MWILDLNYYMFRVNILSLFGVCCIFLLWLYITSFCLSYEKKKKKDCLFEKKTYLLVQVQRQAAVFLVTPKCVHCHLLSMRLTACQKRKPVIKRAPWRANAKFAVKEIRGALGSWQELTKITILTWLYNAE